jgi:hypothetical protein
MRIFRIKNLFAQGRKVIPQLDSNECDKMKTQLIEELFGKKLKFSYKTTDKMTNCY